jgi:hypothetical protein
MGRLREVGRQAVAVFVALHLFAVTVCALPAVGSGLNRTAWKQPTVQGEFEAWTRRLNGWGFTLTRAELEERLWDFASAHEAARSAVLAPFRQYFVICGTWQGWRMFVAPHRFPARLEIDVERNGRWETVYAARSSEHTWLGSMLDHDRFRAALFRHGWEMYRPQRLQFANWVSRRAAEDFPDAQRVRVSFQRYQTRSPEQVIAGVPAEETRDFPQIRVLHPR